jgi:hypothetical protein
MSNENKVKNENTLSELESITEMRKQWQETTYKASCADLYAILGKCLDLYIKCKKDRSLTYALSSYLDINGIKYRKDASLETRLIRAVFVDPRSEPATSYRLNGYRRVIKVAFDNDITGDKLPEFIASQGGIDEVRRKPATDSQPLPDRSELIAIAQEYLSNDKASDLVPAFEAPNALKPAETSSYSVAIVRLNPDDTASIVYGINSAGLLNEALAHAGKQFYESIAKEKQQATRDDVAEKNKQLAADFVREAYGPDATASESTPIAENTQVSELA